MLNNLEKKTNSKGFTIIEVMIVLAIAGLIILIVLLAVPALQRNGRNTAIKNDVSALVAGVSEFTSNNDGLAPLSPPSAQAGSTITLDRTAGTTTPATAKIQGSTVVSFVADPTTAGEVRIQFGAKCNSSTAFATSANPRSTAIKYEIETATALSPRCIDA